MSGINIKGSVKAGRDVNIAQGDINFGTVQNGNDFAAQLENVKAQVQKAKETGLINVSTETDITYNLTKASQEAKSEKPDKNALLTYLNKAKEYLNSFENVSSIVAAIASASSVVQKIF